MTDMENLNFDILYIFLIFFMERGLKKAIKV